MNVRQVIPRDAIPSVDDPSFADRYDGDPDDRLLVVEHEEGARGYPLRILDYHEIVNDVVGGDPIAVTWCPLCGSAVVYDRRVGERVLEFGVSGKLADDDLVMYDRQTDSEWKQSLGVCIDGQLEGARLTVLPGPVTTYAAFERNHPDGVVLRPPGGSSEASGPGAEPRPIDYDDTPYESYLASDEFGLAAHRDESGRQWDRTDIGPKTPVLGLVRDGEAVGFPRPVVEAEGGVVATTVGKTRVVVFTTDTGIEAFADPGYDFEPAADGVRADGTRWNPETGQSDDGQCLQRIPARRLFAFAWQDDHGPASFYGLEP
jgi:hypothetical protein